MHTFPNYPQGRSPEEDEGNTLIASICLLAFIFILWISMAFTQPVSEAGGNVPPQTTEAR